MCDTENQLPSEGIRLIKLMKVDSSYIMVLERTGQLN